MSQSPSISAFLLKLRPFRILTVILIVTTLPNQEALAIDIPTTNLLIKELQAWENAGNKKDIAYFKNRYASNLIMYGKPRSKEDAVKFKLDFFQRIVLYNQSIASPIAITQYENNRYRCDFERLEVIKRRKKITNAYLVFATNTSDEWEIIEEGTLEANSRLNYVPNHGVVIDTEVTPYALREIPESSSASNDNSPNFRTQAGILAVGAAVLGIVMIFWFRRKQKSSIQAQVKNDVAGKSKNEKKPTTSIQDQGLTKEKIKGNLFEEYTTRLFDRAYFKPMRREADLITNGDLPLSSTYPDLEYQFTLREYQKTFSIECKYRSGYFNNCIELDYNQLERYKDYQVEKGQTVYLFIGVGGFADAPAEQFLLKLDELKGSTISRDELKNHRKFGNFFLNRETGILE